MTPEKEKKAEQNMPKVWYRLDPGTKVKGGDKFWTTREKWSEEISCDYDWTVGGDEFFIRRIPTTNDEGLPGLPTDSEERKRIPVYSGFIAYFPDAIIEAAKLSYRGNEQHHPGSPLHWDRSKSQDHLDALMRHSIDALKASDRDTIIKEKAAVLWRAAADLQDYIDREGAYE